uniref:Peptidase A2 domain-containing protein n=1 Tax=Romanomermis culicivorax TaxID=13658 RepID=A0A915L6B2_ROMCU
MDSSPNSSQSSGLELVLPALPSSAIVKGNTPDTCAINQSSSAANMVIPSKEIASAAMILSPVIICWNATGHAFRDPCHIRLSIRQIDNLTPSSKTFIRKYASRQAFQIPIKLGTIKAHALINTGAQCSVLSSGLIKRAFDKQLLQLPICGKIKVADGAHVNAHGPVVITMESLFGEHMIKCVILNDDRNDQCIISTDFLTHPDIDAILNFKENYIKIQDVKLRLKVIALVHSQTELFLNARNDNVLELIPEEERQWVNSTVFPTTMATIPDLIVQPLSINSVAGEFPIETAIVNVTNSHCQLLFVNNTPNSIKLRLNQLIAVAKHMLGQAKSPINCQVATAAADRDLTDHKPAALDKSFPCHTDQQKLEFTLNKMTAKTRLTATQKARALNML